MKTAPPNGKSTPTTVAAPAANRVAAGGSVDKGPGSIDKGTASIDKKSVDKNSVDRKSMDKGSLDKGSMDKAGKTAKGKKKMTPEQQKQMLVVVIAAVVVLAVGIGMFFYFHREPPPHGKEIALNAAADKLEVFVASSTFDELPSYRQLLFIKAMSGKKKDFEANYKSGKINKHDFEEVLALCWLGKQFEHVSHYYALGEIDKKAFLDQLIDKNKIEDIEDRSKPKEDPQKSKEKIKAVVDKMPAPERNAFEGFRRAMKEREKDRIREDRNAAKAAKNAASTTRPTGRAPTTLPTPNTTNTPAPKPAAAGAAGK
jgi:hypothetical protein